MVAPIFGFYVNKLLIFADKKKLPGIVAGGIVPFLVPKIARKGFPAPEIPLITELIPKAKESKQKKMKAQQTKARGLAAAKYMLFNAC